MHAYYITFYDLIVDTLIVIIVLVLLLIQDLNAI